jgi:hypothetical protein
LMSGNYSGAFFRVATSSAKRGSPCSENVGVRDGARIELEIPRTLGEVCDPERIALLAYDMRVSEPRVPKRFAR